jgi:hypothetical protein
MTGSGEIMARRQNLYRQADITRALRAARAAGIDVASVEIDPATGKITITTHGTSGAEQITDLDKWIASHAHQA